MAAASGGVEVYDSVEKELRVGDRARWTRNNPVLGLVNKGMAVVESVERDDAQGPGR